MEKRIERMVKGWKKKTLGFCKEATAKTFQKLVRMRAANKYGMVECVSCGLHVHWKEANGGHYFKRRHSGTLLEEMNVNCQCVRCNLTEDGNLHYYKDWMLETHGQEALDELERKKNTTKQFTKRELAELRIGFMDETKQLEKEKNL